MNNIPTYRAAVFPDRVNVILPRTIGPVRIKPENAPGGVRITIQQDAGGILGSAYGPGWCYASKRAEKRMPTIGTSTAQLVSGLSESGELVLFLPEGVKPRTRAPSAPRKAPQIVVSGPPVERLGEMVRAINERKAALGEALVLSITDEGTLRALVEYG